MFHRHDAQPDLNIDSLSILDVTSRLSEMSKSLGPMVGTLKAICAGLSNDNSLDSTMEMSRSAGL